MTDFRQKLMASFEVEYREHLSAIRGMLAGVGKGSGDGADVNIQEAYRHAHSLKGAARAVDLPPVESLAHRLETLFFQIQKGQLTINGKSTWVIQMVLDGIEDWMAALADTSNPPAPIKAIAAIDELLGIGDGVAGDVVIPPPVASESGEQGVMPLRPKRTAEPETLRVRADNLDRMMRSSGQLLAEGFQQEILSRELRALSRRMDAIQRDSLRFRNVNGSALRRLAETPEYSRVALHTEAMDKQVRELSRHLKNAFRIQDRNAWTFHHLVDELQGAVREARMVSAESVFGAFRKMVRDLAGDEGKEVEIEIRGLQTEADRATLQALKDPVMHLLRNAVKHGIETPTERKRLGKSRSGNITITINARGNRLFVRVEDDGRGVDPSRVASAAVKRGVLSKAEAAVATPEMLLRVLLKPGFTTVDAVTRLAGRGIGLAIAHQAAMQLQGNLDIHATEGTGMAVVISVPLSVSNQNLLLSACNGSTFGFTTDSIERIYQVPEKDLISVEGRPMVRLQERTLPLVHLSRLLGRPEPAARTEGEALPVVVLQDGERRLAVAVDRFLSVRAATIKSFGHNGTSKGRITGAFVLDDGSVALVMNVSGLMDSFITVKDRPPLKAIAKKAERAACRVLVVDDSITTRTLEKSILEAHGFQVHVSVDGVDALRRLRLDPVDLVVADIQMPRMDGFVLLKELKRDKTLSQIPVILVTSRDSADDRHLGLELGAEAYIVKQKFDQKELLETIRQLI